MKSTQAVDHEGRALTFREEVEVSLHTPYLPKWLGEQTQVKFHLETTLLITTCSAVILL
jgi:hypothetical protein